MRTITLIIQEQEQEPKVKKPPSPTITVWNTDYPDFPGLKGRILDWLFEGYIQIVQKARNFTVFTTGINAGKDNDYWILHLYEGTQKPIQ